MVHGEVTLQVLAALTGAGLLSLVLIALINAEAKNRIANPEPQIENVNLLGLLSEKISDLTSSIMGVNRTEEPSEDTDQRGGRRRLHWTGDTGEHHIRHHGKHHNQGQDKPGERPAAPEDKPRGEQARRPQPPCYSGNEVLLIIALTCLLNFAFILLVMACVHYCNKAVSKPETISSKSSLDV